MSNTQEEISIRELMGLFTKLWKKTVKIFLLAVLFVIKHAILLVLLLVIGVGLAYFYKNVNPYFQQNFVVSATEYSGEFLAQKIEEINFKFATNNTEFKESISLQDIDLEGVEYIVKPVYSKGSEMGNSEYQYLKYILDNKIIDKYSLERMLKFSNSSYEIEMIYPVNIDGTRVFNATLEYLRNDSYASELHQTVLADVEMQIEENEKLVYALGDYVVALSDAGNGLDLNENAIMIEGGRGSDLGSMIYAREQTQRINSKLLIKKIQLSENFRLLIKGNPSRYYGKGIISNKMLVFPLTLISAYIFLIFGIYVVRAALALKKEV